MKKFEKTTTSKKNGTVPKKITKQVASENFGVMFRSNQTNYNSETKKQK